MAVTESYCFFFISSLQLEENCPSDIKFFQQPLISTTMTRCPAIFINLSAKWWTSGLLNMAASLRQDRNKLYCIQVFIQHPSTAMGKQRRFWFNQLQEKRQVLRSDKDVERLDDKREARAEGGRRFQREGPITEKDLDIAMVVLVRETKSSRLCMRSSQASSEFCQERILRILL